MNEIQQVHYKLQAADGTKDDCQSLILAGITNLKFELTQLEGILTDPRLFTKINSSINTVEGDIEKLLIYAQKYKNRFINQSDRSLKEVLSNLPSTLGEAEEHDLNKLPHE